MFGHLDIGIGEGDAMFGSRALGSKRAGGTNTPPRVGLSATAGGISSVATGNGGLATATVMGFPIDLTRVQTIRTDVNQQVRVRTIYRAAHV